MLKIELRKQWAKENCCFYPDTIFPAAYVEWLEEKLIRHNSQDNKVCPNCQSNIQLSMYSEKGKGSGVSPDGEHNPSSPKVNNKAMPEFPKYSDIELMYELVTEGFVSEPYSGALVRIKNKYEEAGNLDNAAITETNPTNNAIALKLRIVRRTIAGESFMARGECLQILDAVIAKLE